MQAQHAQAKEEAQVGYRASKALAPGSATSHTC